MKTKEEILKQEPIYLHNWADDKKKAMVCDFENIYYPVLGKYAEENEIKVNEALKRYESKHILFATYGEDNYSGDAWVLYEEDGELFEVNAGHCSCFGLEGQFSGEVVVLEELKNRLEKGNFGVDDWSDNEFASELKIFLGLE